MKRLVLALLVFGATACGGSQPDDDTAWDAEEDDGWGMGSAYAQAATPWGSSSPGAAASGDSQECRVSLRFGFQHNVTSTGCTNGQVYIGALHVVADHYQNKFSP